MRKLCDPVRIRPLRRSANSLYGCTTHPIAVARTLLLRICACAWVAIAMVPGATVHATEVIRWQRQPIEVELHVGQERILFVDRPMRVAVPSSLIERLRVQSADGAVYLLAKDAFQGTRVELQDAETGTLVLLNVRADQPDQPEALEPMRILLTATSGETTKAERRDAESNSEDTHVQASQTPTAVLLTRYAAQSLYAPLRTVESLPGITPISVHPLLDLSSLLPTLPVSLTVLAAWRLQDEWVTALRVTNLSSTWESLDPRRLQGDFATATFQHRRLGPHGESTDTTVLYLVTQGHGLAESLLPAISPVDADRNMTAPAVRESADEK